MVNRDDEARTRFVGHLDGLLRRAVAADPRVVRANRHGDDVDWPAMADVAEAGARRVAGNRDAVAPPFEQIPVEPPVDVLAHARAPVTDAEGLDLHALVRVLETPSLAPPELDDLAEPQAPQQIARGRRGDDDAVARELAQRADVEMIHVRVCQQDEVDRRQLPDAQRRRDEAFRAERHDARADADAREQRRIGEDPDAVEVDEERGVTEPREREPIVTPRRWIGLMRSGGDAAPGPGADLPPVLRVVQPPLPAIHLFQPPPALRGFRGADARTGSCRSWRP